MERLFQSEPDYPVCGSIVPANPKSAIVMHDALWKRAKRTVRFLARILRHTQQNRGSSDCIESIVRDRHKLVRTTKVDWHVCGENARQILVRGAKWRKLRTRVRDNVGHKGLWVSGRRGRGGRLDIDAHVVVSFHGRDGGSCAATSVTVQEARQSHS